MARLKPMYWGQFYGGITTDPNLGQTGSFYDGENIEIREDSKSISLTNNNLTYGVTPGGTTITNTRAGGQYVAMMAEGLSNQLFLTEDGYLTDALGTLVSSTLGTCYQMGRINAGSDKGYIVTSTGLIKTWAYNASANDLGAGTGISDEITLTNGVVEVVKTLEQTNFLFIGSSNYVYTIDTSAAAWVETAALELDKGFNVVGISNIGDQIIIYATDGTHSKQYYWDGVSENILRYIDWYDKPILTVANLNNIDYVTIRNDNISTLYRVLGYETQKLAEGVYDSNDIDSEIRDKFYFEGGYSTLTGGYSNMIETTGDIILLPSRGQVYSYGNKTPGIPKSIIREIKLLGEITCMYSNSSTSTLYLFATGNDYYGTTTNYVITYNYGKLTNAKTTYIPGRIEFLPYYAQDYSAEKNTIKLRVGYKLDEDTKINVYAKTNDRLEFANFYTYETEFGSYTTAPSVGDVYSDGTYNYTVTAITTKRLASQGLIIHCTYTGDSKGDYTGTLTKVSGAGQTTFKFLRSNYGYKLIDTITDTSVFQKTFMYNENFHKLDIACDLISGRNASDVRLYNVILISELVNNDL